MEENGEGDHRSLYYSPKIIPGVPKREPGCHPARQGNRVPGVCGNWGEHLSLRTENWILEGCWKAEKRL